MKQIEFDEATTKKALYTLLHDQPNDWTNIFAAAAHAYYAPQDEEQKKALEDLSKYSVDWCALRDTINRVLSLGLPQRETGPLDALRQAQLKWWKGVSIPNASEAVLFHAISSILHYEEKGMGNSSGKPREPVPADGMSDENIGVAVTLYSNRYGFTDTGNYIRSLFTPSLSVGPSADAKDDRTEDASAAGESPAHDKYTKANFWKKRAEKAEAALQRVRREAEDNMRDLPADQTYGGGVRQGLLMAVCAAGFVVKPEIPAQPLRVVWKEGE